MAYDLSFVDRYDREMSKFGHIRQTSEVRINEDVMQALENADQMQSELADMNDFANMLPALNDEILSSEGFTREDFEQGRLPAYMQARMHDESVVNTDYVEQADEVQRDLFEAAYHVDAVLTRETRDALGPDYASFVAEKEEQNAKAGTALMKEAMAQNGARSVLFDRQTGESHLSLTDEYGNPTDDPYAFDEF